jgi:hypothetical protein
MGFCYGQASSYRLYLHPHGAPGAGLAPGKVALGATSSAMLFFQQSELLQHVYCGLQQKGVLMGLHNGGYTLAARGATELQRTCDAYSRVLADALRPDRGIEADP